MSEPDVASTFSPPSPSADTELDHSVQRALLAAIVESSDDAIVSKSLDGRILSWNAGAQRIFGYSAEEAIGQSITLIIPPELHEEEERILEQLRRGQRIDHFDTTRLTKDGRRIAISLTVSPVRDGHGRIVAASKVARDISERKRIEQALRASEEALRNADRRKNQFLALLAHELRNPLAPIRYALAAWKKPDTTPEQRRHAEEIFDRQLSQMSRLLDDLLDISRITHDTLKLQRVSVDLAAVVAMAVETARPLVDSKQQVLQVEISQPGPCLQADPARLAQVFANLLINAAKYTDAGGRIQLRAVQDRGEMVVVVRDNGIGIAPDMLPRVFDIFAQADAALGRAQGGLGLGLALVQGLVSLHGGSIEARSRGIGHGSEFIVHLPLSVESVPSRPAAVVNEDPQPCSALNILVVDDNADAADGCAMYLTLNSHRVETAYSGQQALAVGEHFRPDVVLLDIGLPDIDGYSLVPQIRASEWGASILLIAVTGWGQEEHRQRAFEAGFDHHLTKPLEPERIEAVLRSYAPGRPKPAPSANFSGCRSAPRPA